MALASASVHAVEAAPGSAANTCVPRVCSGRLLPLREALQGQQVV